MARGQAGQLPYSFEFIAAPSDLADYVNSFYIFRCEEDVLEDALPAYSGQMIAYLKGRAELEFGEGRRAETSDAFFVAPLTRARPFHLSGPALSVGVSLNFLGWAAFTRLPCNEYRDDLLPLETCLSDSLCDQMRAFAPDYRSGEASPEALVERLAPIVREGLSKVSQKHTDFIRDTLTWLSSSFRPDLEEFYDQQSYSQRQIQRLTLRFFGQTPIHLVRRYRAIRAATLLSMPELPKALEDEIREAFYDQAHMIKEIRLFTGRTPKRLLPKAGSVVTDMLGPDGYGVVDLFGGNEAEQLGRK